MPNNPSRAQILAMVDARLDEACAQMREWLLLTTREEIGGAIVDGKQGVYWIHSDGTIGYINSEGRAADWHPSEDDYLGQVREMELALTPPQQPLYVHELLKLVLTDTARGYWGMITASATTRCRALLLAVLAPED
jgi:hypothetical protein